MANANYFPTESDKKTYIFVCTTSNTIMLLETIIEAENNPKNVFPN
jgi:hypothetical protein